MSQCIRSIAVLLLSAGLMQGSGAQFNVSGPGFLPDENGTNLDDPQAKKGAPKVAAGAVIKDCAECPEMVVIPAGSFVMGSDSNAEEKPPHKVMIQSFLMGRTKVTQKLWLQVMDSNPSRFRDCGLNCPVENVNWNQVEDFIRKLRQQTGHTYRLPSEAEWEYAAKAGTATEWSFGNDESRLGNYVWYRDNSGGRTQEVGQKLPNTFGLFDMHGNVWEWIQDCWHKSYVGAPTDGGAWVTNCADKRRVVRGGSWDSTPPILRPTFRGSSWPGSQDSFGGFRLAQDPPNSEAAARAEETRKQAEAAIQPKTREEIVRKQLDEQRRRILEEAIAQSPTSETTLPNAGKISDKYAASIQAAIRPNITFGLDTVAGNPAVEIQVGLTAYGTIISVTVIKKSGVGSWDAAASRAIWKTERLPKDENGQVPSTLLITLRPREN